ncbi:MAG TPA: hypothetical protein VNV66_18405, partial [Pilimelia sp.]|nr:hypothetical protein [Pilimelia sp.]
DPETAVDELVRGTDDRLSLRGLVGIEPGPLGGFARCGQAVSSGVDVGVCFWADRGALGVIFVYFAGARDAEALFVEIRGAVQRRS